MEWECVGSLVWISSSLWDEGAAEHFGATMEAEVQEEQRLSEDIR